MLQAASRIGPGWWVPGADWIAEAIVIDPAMMAPLDPVAVLSSTFEPQQQGMRIAAVSTEGDVLVYKWRPAQGSTWLFENLSGPPTVSA
jgi:hypothetical protein